MGKDTYELELELKIASDKMKQGGLRIAQSYIDSLNARLKSMGVLDTTPIAQTPPAAP